MSVTIQEIRESELFPGKYEVTVEERTPTVGSSWVQWLFGNKAPEPEVNRITYVGHIVWRELRTGVRASLGRSAWLEESVAQWLHRQAIQDAVERRLGVTR